VTNYFAAEILAAWRCLPQSAAPCRGASAGINTAVLSQKRLERLMVGVPRYGSTQQYCLIFWLIACHELYGE